MSGNQQIKVEDLHFLNRIGSGGFATVFKARLHGQEVAAKRLNEPDNHEVDILATLHHPHIVNLIGTAENKFDFYLILEFCNGGSLRSYLNQERFDKKLLPIDQIYNWAQQAVRPLQYLRERNLVHKDIKSENYLIGDGDILKLADFGITKNIENTIQNATQRCSPAYSAPELLKDSILSPSYDISAYGVIVWELCTTLVPFEGSGRNHIIWRICKNNERPPIPANCPKPLADLMSKCWEVDWKKRPSADEILNLLTLQLSLAEKKVFIDGPWKCKKVFWHAGQQEPGRRGYAGIAINPTNQDVVVVDYFVRKLMIYHSTGESKFTNDLIQGNPLWWLWNVVVSNEGHYYTTNATQFVFWYNQSGEYTSKWVAASPDNTPLDGDDIRLGGLAIDPASNLLLVGVLHHNYISKHYLYLDGFHVNSFKVNIAPLFLSVTSQGTIIISDLCKAQVIDQTGQLLHTLTPPFHMVKCWTPYGVCCHKGIIFICNPIPHQVVCFSMHGEYIGYIPVDNIPHYLTFVPGQKKFLIASFTNKSDS